MDKTSRVDQLPIPRLCKALLFAIVGLLAAYTRPLSYDLLA